MAAPTEKKPLDRFPVIRTDDVPRAGAAGPVRATPAALAGGQGHRLRHQRRHGPRELAAALRALPESAWRLEREDAYAVRHWAEVPYVPGDGVTTKDRPAPPRYLTVRITRKQGELFADGSAAKPFAIVTNLPDPDGGTGLDLIRWQRAKAGSVEHAHHVLTYELAAEALPSQKFGANAAWFRLNVLLYNLLSAFKRIALPAELHDARPKRLRFVLLNGVGKVVRHARETVLRLVGEARRRLADQARLALGRAPPLVTAA